MVEVLMLLFAGLHTAGAALGAGGSLYAELFFTLRTHAREDKERAWFATTYTALVWGMCTVLLSSIALNVLEYAIPGSPEAYLYAPLWMQYTLSLVILASAWLLSRRAFPWWLGSSLVFAGWWMLLALDAWSAISTSYIALIFLYVMFVFISGGVWSYLRILSSRTSEKGMHQSSHRSTHPV